MSGEQVLVTGGSGFIGAHCIVQLLKAGYRVRTTVRSLKREGEVRAMLRVGGVEDGSALTFAEADLTADTGWGEAVLECAYVLHVASPFPPGAPKHEDELIVPAREGALRVLRAARASGVKRVVMTSSFAAIGYGHKPLGRPFTEADWTDLSEGGVAAYPKSKTIAERAAWDFVAKEGGGLELAVVNPVAVFGPVFGPDFSTSIMLVQRMLEGTMPGMPRLSFGIVDVRDVADLHLRAMIHPAAKGERFLAVAGEFMSVQAMAQLLKARMGDAGRRVPTRIVPNWIVRLLGLVDSTAALAVSELGKVKSATHDKAVRMLGWTPRSNEEAILATAESMLKLGLVKSIKKAG